jgi:glycosyltransferase involved in cell wall biosynthesis
VLFSEINDSDSVAECIVRLCTDTELRKRLSENGKQFIAENNWNKDVERYLNIINRLIPAQSKKISKAIN